MELVCWFSSGDVFIYTQFCSTVLILYNTIWIASNHYWRLNLRFYQIIYSINVSVVWSLLDNLFSNSMGFPPLFVTTNNKYYLVPTINPSTNIAPPMDKSPIDIVNYVCHWTIRSLSDQCYNIGICFFRIPSAHRYILLPFLYVVWRFKCLLIQSCPAMMFYIEHIVPVIMLN